MSLVWTEPKAIKIWDYQLLPSTYQEVKYIWFSWNQVLETDVTSLTAPFKVEVKYMKSNGATSDQTLVWQRQMWKFVNIYNNFYENLWSNTASWTANWDGLIHTIVTDSSAWLYKDWTLLLSWTSWDRSSSYPLLIWAFSEDSYSSAKWKFVGRIYDIKITSNWNLYRHYMPCYRISDGVVGMYETQTNTFLTNLWTWALTKWNDVSNDRDIKAVYLWTTKIRPSSYSSYTLAYYKLETDFNDYSWNSFNSTWQTNVTITTLNGVKCAYLNQWRIALPAFTNFSWIDFTYLLWTNISTSQSKPHSFISTWASWTDKLLNVRTNDNTTWLNYWWYWDDLSVSYTITRNVWHLLAVTYNKTSKYWVIYWDGAAVWNKTFSNPNVTANTIYLWVNAEVPNNTQYMFQWYMSNALIENKVWGAEEILAYYNATKSKYWL